MCKPSSRVAVLLALALAVATGSAAAQQNAGSPAAPPAAVKGAAKAPPQQPAPAQPGAGSPQQAQVTSPAPAVAPPAGAPPVVAPGGLLVPGSEFRYDPAGRRDPFKSLLQLEAKQRDVSQLPPIQQIELDTVKVIGIVVDKARGAQAMVRAPNGQTFVVRVGTIIGRNEGEVVEITLQGIKIVEKYLDFMNRETRKETFLKSHPTAGK